MKQEKVVEDVPEKVEITPEKVEVTPEKADDVPKAETCKSPRRSPARQKKSNKSPNVNKSPKAESGKIATESGTVAEPAVAAESVTKVLSPKSPRRRNKTKETPDGS